MRSKPPVVSVAVALALATIGPAAAAGAAPTPGSAAGSVTTAWQDGRDRKSVV